jgi:hypothetical protein
LLSGLGEESAGQRRVSIERNAEFSEHREQFRLLATCHGGIVALVDGWEHVALGLGDVVGLLNVLGGVVRQTKALKDAGLVDFVDGSKGLLEVGLGIGRVDVEDVDLYGKGKEG